MNRDEMIRQLDDTMWDVIVIGGGATGLGWARFTIWGAGGELVWVSLYVGLGVGFAENIAAVAEVTSDTSGILAAGFVTVFLGWRLLAVLRQHRKMH